MVGFFFYITDLAWILVCFLLTLFTPSAVTPLYSLVYGFAVSWVFSHRKLMVDLSRFGAHVCGMLWDGGVSYAHHVLRCASGNCL